MGAAFQIRKGEKEFLGPRRGGGFVAAWRRGGAFCKARLVRLPGEGLLFYEEK